MLIGLVGVVWAHESIPQEVLVSDSIPIFESVEIDSGWIPDSGALAIRLQVVADGGLDVEMLGDGHLGWPEDLNLSFEPQAGTGRALLHSDIFPQASLKFDVAGYAWEIDAPIELGSFSFEGEQWFDPFLYGTSMVMEETTDATLYETGFSVLSVVNLNFRAEMEPFTTVHLQGVGWQVGEEMITEEGGSVSFPAEPAGSFDTVAAFLADIGMDIELEFVPVFEVCVNLIVTEPCYDWDAGEFPVTNFSNAFTHTFPDNELHFPLPLVQVEAEGNDFGELGVGETSNWQVGIANEGELPAIVEARITGDTDSFSVFPGTAYATEDLSDGVMVSFTPGTEGSFEAVLELATNDPSMPLILLPLQGSASEEASSGDDLGSAKLDPERIEGCACSTGSVQPKSAAFWLAGMALLWWRRRS
jgi:MYXO-CTERM domain-containing protein